ncbi:MAG: hypothetical protein ACR2NL_05880, partial [Acidimicrobiia bacterium]
GVSSFVWFGAEGAARTLLTIGFAGSAVVGMGRLAGRLGFRGPGRYLSGLVLLAGPGTALLAGRGAWVALGAAAVLPWAVRAMFVHRVDEQKSRWSLAGSVMVWSLVLAAFSPGLAVAPLLVWLLWLVTGGRDGKWWLALLSILGLLAAAAFIIGDPGWLADEQRRLGLLVPDLWPLLIAVVAALVLLGEPRTRRLGLVGAGLALAVLAVLKIGVGGPGVEEALLVTASFGTALLTAAALDTIAGNFLEVVGSLAGAAVLVLSVVALGDGRLGLAPGDQNERLSFSNALAGESGPGRLLIVSEDRQLVSGESRPGPGFWYRTIDGEGLTIDQAWLPAEQAGDDALGAVVRQIATGSELRPGELLAPFAIDWVVVEGQEGSFDDALSAQLDLVPTPLITGARVFENSLPSVMASAGSGLVWHRDGTGFSGPESGSNRVRISHNGDSGWSPEPGSVDWAASVAATTGSATFRTSGVGLMLPIASALLFLFAIAAMVVGRVRR